MKAITARKPGGPEVLAVADVEQPAAGAGELLVQVRAAGVNRADLMQRQGYYDPPPGSSPILGLEVSGQIAEVGEGVAGWAVGDPCVALLAGGGYAEYVNVPAGQVLPPPPGVPLLAAAGSIEVAATVYSTLTEAQLAAGEVLLVHGGSGGVGSFAIQYAKSLRATVVATAGSADKLDYCRSVGADHAYSYRDDWSGAVREDVGPVDVILDSIGAKYLETHVGLLGVGGRLVVIGLQGGRRGTLDLGALLPLRALVTALSLRQRPPAEKAAICAGVREHVWPLLADGTIRLAPQTVFPLAEAAAAHAQLESGHNLGKILLDLQPGT